VDGQTEFTIGFVVVCFGLGYGLVVVVMNAFGKKQPPPAVPLPPLPPGEKMSEAEQHHRNILGVPWNAGEIEITRAYMQLRAQYDPNKVSHLGEEFQSMAMTKTQEVMAAYQYLRDRLGFR
jgi:hypothetical protein